MRERRPARTHKAVLPRRCRCGSRLRWESSSSGTAWAIHWLAFCASESCGRVSYGMDGEVDPEDALRVFLLGERRSEPYCSPWMRLFLRAGAVSGGEGWRPHPEPCWQCDEPSTMRFSLLPVQNPYQAVMCLKCGALRTSHRTPPNDWGQLVGGSDWTQPDPAASAFIRGLRELSEQAPKPPPPWWQWFAS